MPDLKAEFDAAAKAAAMENNEKAQAEMTPELKALGEIVSLVRRDFFSARKSNIKQRIDEIVTELKD